MTPVDFQAPVCYNRKERKADVQALQIRSVEDDKIGITNTGIIPKC